MKLRLLLAALAASLTFFSVAPAQDAAVPAPSPALTELQALVEKITTKLRAGSPEGANAEITYSADGGKSFAVADRLTVAARDTSGKAVTRAAVAADLTHVRWALKEPLAPGASGFVRFKAVIQ